MAEIVMPRLSDTMEEGTILRWLKSDGEEVARGEELVEIETDKATMIYESDQQGTLAIVAAEGTTLAVGEVIAHVGDGAPAPTPAMVEDAPAAPRATPPPTHEPADDSERIKASPLARRIAQRRESTCTTWPAADREDGS